MLSLYRIDVQSQAPYLRYNAYNGAIEIINYYYYYYYYYYYCCYYYYYCYYYSYFFRPLAQSQRLENC